MLSTSAASQQGAEVLVSHTGRVTEFQLNRPAALNALSLNMVQLLQQGYRDSDGSCYVLSGVGKAFCAGGDVKTVVRQCAAQDLQPAVTFFRREFSLDYTIATLRKPHVAVLDGVCMGGGVGVSSNGSFQIATERTVMAMPECAIGFFPDVGASHFLSALPGSLGLYLALTGARLRGPDVKAAGLATHYCHSSAAASLVSRLSGLGAAAADPAAVDAVLSSLESTPPQPPTQQLVLTPDARAAIDAAFSQDDMPAIMRATQDASECDHFEDATRALMRSASEAMSSASALSLCVTLSLMRRNRGLTLQQCLKVENRIAHRMCEGAADGSSDFLTGVRSVLIDKSRSAPAWLHASPSDVPAAAVERFFQPLANDLELPPTPAKL